MQGRIFAGNQAHRFYSFVFAQKLSGFCAASRLTSLHQNYKAYA
jgi:hypothetical protein